MALIFFFTMFKIQRAFRNAVETSENIFSFFDNCLGIGWVKLSILPKKNLSETEVLSEWTKNPKKILLCIFQQCLGPFNMLTVLVCTETWLFRHLYKHVFRRQSFRKYIRYEAQIFFLERSKLNLDLRNVVKT